MPGSLRVAPRPRKRAPTPTYPVLQAVGLAVALTACASQPLMSGRRWVGREPPGAAASAEPHPVMLLATDPQTQNYYPPPVPQPEAAMELIEDPASTSQNVACAGDCPATYRTGGPSADIRYRVESGELPDARFVLSQVQTTLHACAVRTAARAGWVQVRASVRSDGGLQPIEVRSDGDQNSEQVSCVANAVLASRFGRRWNSATILVIVEVAAR
jgi:hypothetical protein